MTSNSLNVGPIPFVLDGFIVGNASGDFFRHASLYSSAIGFCLGPSLDFMVLLLLLHPPES
jgi:hypothetical protein